MLELFLLSIDTPEQNSKVEAIYINYYDKMVQVAYRILKNMPDSEDAAMNALMKICKDPERHIHYEDENDLKAMLYTITEHKAIDCFRKNRRSRKKTVPLDEDLAGGIFELEDPEQDLAEIAIREENKNTLVSAIEELDVMYRAPLLLKYKYDYNTAKIADYLDITASTVHVRLHRAKKLLRKKLLERGYIK
ncbi:MAG: RNA polymerase sigma factor [Clostridia bacterium]|nr:RNA polymerase sigma factor [Clostridia bacterium]